MDFDIGLVVPDPSLSIADNALAPEENPQQTVEANREQIERLGSELEGIKQILREGFRLPAQREQ